MKTEKCPVCDWAINDGGIKMRVGGKEITDLECRLNLLNLWMVSTSSAKSAPQEPQLLAAPE